MMTPEEFDKLPRLDLVTGVENTSTILEFAAALEAKGEAPVFQVWYHEADGRELTDADTYDVLEVVGESIATVPGKLVAEAEAREAARA